MILVVLHADPVVLPPSSEVLSCAWITDDGVGARDGRWW